MADADGRATGMVDLGGAFIVGRGLAFGLGWTGLAVFEAVSPFLLPV